jgi:hypothetical protein
MRVYSPYIEHTHRRRKMATYTYVVVYMDSEIAFAEAESFEAAREEALNSVDARYPKEDLEFIANCPGIMGNVTGLVASK